MKLAPGYVEFGPGEDWYQPTAAEAALGAAQPTPAPLKPWAPASAIAAVEKLADEFVTLRAARAARQRPGP